MALAKKTTEHPHHTPLYSRVSNEETTAWPEVQRKGGETETAPNWRHYERNGSTFTPGNNRKVSLAIYWGESVTEPNNSPSVKIVARMKVPTSAWASQTAIHNHCENTSRLKGRAYHTGRSTTCSIIGHHRSQESLLRLPPIHRSPNGPSRRDSTITCPSGQLLTE